MSRIIRLARDSSGATIIEFAIILPVLVLFIYGIYLIGQLFQANAGMQHGLGEGARLATICVQTSGGCASPSDDEIKSRISSEVYGTGRGTLTVADPVTGAGYKDLSVTYSMPMDFLLFTGPTVTVTRSKRVYLAS